jgi:HEAT repeat protein
MRLKILICAGIILIFGVFLYWDKQANHKFTSVLSIEPTYEGQTLRYWLEHWYQQYGQRNLGAEEAVRTMGTNAVPYLVKWITQPARTTADYDWVGRALKGFEILGPVASPAIPDLVKAIGRNGNFPACALGYIGTNAIPALTNRLIEIISISNQPAKHQSLFLSSGHPRENFYVPMNIFCALSFYGTNARPAVPALIAYIQNPNARESWEAVGVLAMAGHNQPEIVFPVLFQAFSNSTGNVKASVADALSTFGTNAVPAIPILLSGQQDPDANARAHIAVAIKQIAPQTPNALEPVIQNLEHREACQQTLFILGTLGTNGVEALPALLKCLRDPDAQVRTDTARCLQKIDSFPDEIIVALGENISHANEFAAQEAEFALAQCVSHSKLAFVTLIKKGIYGGIGGQILRDAEYPLVNVSRDNPKFLLECLDDPDAKVRAGTLFVFHDLNRSVPESIPKLQQMATNDPDTDVRTRAADVLQLQLHGLFPRLPTPRQLR